MMILIISIVIGMICLVGFGALLFNDEHKDWGITIFSGIFGFSCIAIPVLIMLWKIYR